MRGQLLGGCFLRAATNRTSGRVGRRVAAQASLARARHCARRADAACPRVQGSQHHSALAAGSPTAANGSGTTTGTGAESLCSTPAIAPAATPTAAAAAGADGRRTRAEAAGRAKSAVVHRCFALAEHPECEAHRPAARATPRAATTLRPTVTAVPITRGEGPTTTTWPRRHHPSRGESVPSAIQTSGPHIRPAHLHTVPGRAKRSASARSVTHLPRMLRGR